MRARRPAPAGAFALLAAALSLLTPLPAALAREAAAERTTVPCAPAGGKGLPTAPTPQAALGNALTGGLRTHAVRPGESLALIGARHGIQPRILARDNGLAPTARLKPGQSLSIDARRVVPALLREGLLINVPQRMLFRFADGRLADAHPVGLGRPDWPTPLGAFSVAEKRIDKPWIVPPSIQEEMRREGKEVLTRVEPGPDNPLGRHWIGTSITGIGIHGTIAPASVHDLRSHGCIRLHPDDVADLFERVSVGTPGEIVYHPALLAELPDGRLFVEVNRDAYRRAPPPVDALRALADARGLSARIDWSRVERIAREQEGVAREVGLAPADAPASPRQEIVAPAPSTTDRPGP